MRGRIISYSAAYRREKQENRNAMSDKLKQTQQTYKDNPTTKTKRDWIETKQLYDISAEDVEENPESLQGP